MQFVLTQFSEDVVSAFVKQLEAVDVASVTGIFDATMKANQCEL